MERAEQIPSGVMKARTRSKLGTDGTRYLAAKDVIQSMFMMVVM